jgi:hypothetical protein
VVEEDGDVRMGLGVREDSGGEERAGDGVDGGLVKGVVKLGVLAEGRQETGKRRCRQKER